MSNKLEPSLTMIIDAPINYERTHTLAECPLCNSPNPYLDMHMEVREFGSFDICLYTCSTLCDCAFGSETDPIIHKDTLKPHKHKFSIKHELLRDADHLKIYNRTHFKDVW